MSAGHLIIGFLLMIPLAYSLTKHMLKRNYREGDILQGSEDGVFRRYPEGVIEYYRHEFDIHRIVINKPVFRSADSIDFNYEEIEGKRKTVIYKIPLQHNPLPVYEFYMNEFERLGFEIIYSVYGKDSMGKPDQWISNLFITGKNYVAWKDLSMIMRGDIHCYISGIKKNGNNMMYASVFAVNHYRNNKKTGVFIFITPKPEN
jgi:hypothetical protein